MTQMKRQQTISTYLALGCVVIGSALYILFRPRTLLMFYWADSLGLTKSIDTMRRFAHGFDGYLPTWIVCSLPFALWVSSYLFFVRGIWWNSTSLVSDAWFWCIPVVAIAAELAQSVHIIPGHFDLVDLITIILATVLGLCAGDLNELNKAEATS